MKTARYPFESPAMQRDPVRAIITTPSRLHRDRSSIIRSSSSALRMHLRPPHLLSAILLHSFADKQEAASGDLPMSLARP